MRTEQGNNYQRQEETYVLSSTGTRAVTILAKLQQVTQFTAKLHCAVSGSNLIRSFASVLEPDIFMLQEAARVFLDFAAVALSKAAQAFLEGQNVTGLHQANKTQRSCNRDRCESSARTICTKAVVMCPRQSHSFLLSNCSNVTCLFCWVFFNLCLGRTHIFKGHSFP